jgi:hypothetical protein
MSTGRIVRKPAKSRALTGFELGAINRQGRHRWIRNVLPCTVFIRGHKRNTCSHLRQERESGKVRGHKRSRVRPSFHPWETVDDVRM